ncbi:hypothetical protein FRC11_000292 [Ceratobasidium sp. 423]|nr:hypothetical protein FRC11_000292 [Ceratobasidium sp. 423]
MVQLEEPTLVHPVLALGIQVAIVAVGPEQGHPLLAHGPPAAHLPVAEGLPLAPIPVFPAPVLGPAPLPVAAPLLRSLFGFPGELQGNLIENV